MSGYEARVVSITHPFLQDPLPKILAEAEAGGHQAVIAAVGLRESADDRSGHQSTVRENGQHHPRTPLQGCFGLVRGLAADPRLEMKAGDVNQRAYSSTDLQIIAVFKDQSHWGFVT